MQRGDSITIQEIAKLAEVSVATVSRVMNENHNVSQRTKEKVLKIATENGYVPNLLARHLRTNETKIILVLLTTIANNFCNKVVQGINKAARSKGYSMMICPTNDNPEAEKSYLNLVQRHMADGAILLSTTLNGEQLESLASTYNIVQCSEYVNAPSAPIVAIDNKKAAYDATTHLINLGCKKIAYIGVANHLISSELRFRGFVQALNDAKIALDMTLIRDGNYGYKRAIELTDDLIHNTSGFDGLFAISDRMAAGSITALTSHGISVPGDIPVIGFDNTDITYLFTPTITTVSQPQNEMGKQAFEMLHNIMKNKEKTVNKSVNNNFLQHKLVIRNSTIK